MKTLYQKLNNNHIIYFFILVFTIIWINELNFLFYNIVDGPDFQKYKAYLNYFFQEQTNTGLEQGLLYFYLQAINLKIFYLESGFSNLVLHKSIIQVNLLFYLITLIGIFKLLSLLNFDKKNIYLTLIFLNFFPPLIALRLTFKPEILALAMLPWIVYYLELFLINKELLNLYKIIPFLLATITSKGNVLVIVSSYLLFTYGKVFVKSFNKNIAIAIILLISFFIALSLENTAANKKSLLNIQSGSAQESNYDFKASPTVIYRTNLFKLFTSPKKHDHANSFIAITLLETSGDYFDLFWDNDAVPYFKNRREIITFEESNLIVTPKLDLKTKTITISQQRKTDVYIRESLGMVLSLFLFSLFIKLFISDKKYRKYYSAIFFGMAFILLHSITGFPRNNFDPLVGDTFKPMYYSFVFIFSFSFFIVRSLTLKIIKPSYIFIYALLIIFILGFPKYNDASLQSSINSHIQTSIFCNVEKKLILTTPEFNSLDCGMDMKTYSKSNNIYNLRLKPVNLLLSILIFLTLLTELKQGYLAANFFKRLK